MVALRCHGTVEGHGGGNMEARFVRCWRIWRGSHGSRYVTWCEGGCGNAW